MYKLSWDKYRYLSENDYVSRYKVKWSPFELWINLQRKRNHSNFIQLSYSIATLSVKFFYDKRTKLRVPLTLAHLNFLTSFNLQGNLQIF